MRTVMIALAVTLAFGTLAPAAMAANARHPYSNIDRRLDKGGPTGDDQVDRLNQQQLDAARAANGPTSAPMGAPGYDPAVPARPLGQ